MDAMLELSPARLHLLLAPRSIRRRMMMLFTARLARAGPVCVLDGGNSFDAYGLARELRRQGGGWQAALERTSVARAFTCYQMAALLSQTAVGREPALVLDLLDTFADESVPLAERRRLLRTGLVEVQRLGRQSTVVISAAPAGQPVELLAELQAVAGQIWRFEDHVPVVQPRLFPEE
jgi:hypothetical protein